MEHVTNASPVSGLLDKTIGDIFKSCFRSIVMPEMLLMFGKMSKQAKDKNIEEVALLQNMGQSLHSTSERMNEYVDQLMTGFNEVEKKGETFCIQLTERMSRLETAVLQTVKGDDEIISKDIKEKTSEDKRQVTRDDLDHLLKRDQIKEAFTKAIAKEDLLTHACSRLDPINVFKRKCLSPNVTISVLSKLEEQLDSFDFAELEKKCAFMEEGIISLDDSDSEFMLDGDQDIAHANLKHYTKNPYQLRTFRKKLRKLNVLVDSLKETISSSKISNL